MSLFSFFVSFFVAVRVLSHRLSHVQSTRIRGRRTTRAEAEKIETITRTRTETIAADARGASATAEAHTSKDFSGRPKTARKGKRTRSQISRKGRDDGCRHYRGAGTRRWPTSGSEATGGECHGCSSWTEAKPVGDRGHETEEGSTRSRSSWLGLGPHLPSWFSIWLRSFFSYFCTLSFIVLDVSVRVPGQFDYHWLVLTLLCTSANNGDISLCFMNMAM